MPHTTLARAVAVAGLALIAAACGPVRASEPDPAPSPTDVIDVSSVSFTADFAPVELPNGWLLRHCEGDAPILCIEEGDTTIGAVRLSAYPAEPGLDLAAHVEDLYDSLSAERAEICGPDYVVLPEPARLLQLDGDPAVRFAYTATRGGAPTERFIGVIVAAADARYSVVAEAYSEDACVAVDEVVFSPTDLDTFEAWFLDIVEGAELSA